MKYLLYVVVTVALFSCTSCTTTETFSSDGKRLTKTSGPSPETWTAISNAVGTFGAGTVNAWTQQISNEQRWQNSNK